MGSGKEVGVRSAGSIHRRLPHWLDHLGPTTHMPITVGPSREAVFVPYGKRLEATIAAVALGLEQMPVAADATNSA